MLVASGTNFIGDIPDFDDVTLRRRIGHERSDAREAHENAFVLQLSEGPMSGHPRNSELFHQLGFGIDPIARTKIAPADAVLNILLDRGVARLWRGHPKPVFNPRQNRSPACPPWLYREARKMEAAFKPAETYARPQFPASQQLTMTAVAQ